MTTHVLTFQHLDHPFCTEPELHVSPDELQHLIEQGYVEIKPTERRATIMSKLVSHDTAQTERRAW